jgi:hypothetical protein
MKRNAHPFVPAVLLLLAALAVSALHAAPAAPAVASPAVISQLFCSANRTAAQPPVQGLDPSPLPMASGTCGCGEIVCQGFPIGTVCGSSGGQIYRCQNLSGLICGETTGHGPGKECDCAP